MKPMPIDLPFPILTPRLLIRPAASGDGPALYSAVEESRDQLRPWMPWARSESSVEISEQACREAHSRFLTREDIRLCLFDRRSGELAGGSGLHRISFPLLEARRVSIYCNASNVKSRAVAERLGFPLEGVLRNNDPYASPEVACRDHAVYARTSPEGLPPLDVAWQASPSLYGARMAASARPVLTCLRHRRPRMIRRMKSGKYRLYSRKLNQRTGRRRNLGTFPNKEGALRHEREIQYFKRRGA